MLVIRFARRGRRNAAFYDLVVAEKARPVKRKFLEKVGFYDPHRNGGEGLFEFNAERIAHFVGNGAQISDSAAKRLAKAGMKEAEKFIAFRAQKPPKPKEEPAAEEAPEAPEATPEEAPAAEEVTEAPAE